MADGGAAQSPKPSSSVKLVLLGEAAVGKSSLVLRFVNNDFQENKEPTIGAAFLTQKCSLPTRTIKFEIWDTAGQERFASLAPMYYRNAQAALVVYDITKPSSLTKAKHWVAELQRQASPGIVIALVGNKLDLTNEAGDEHRGDGGQGVSSPAPIDGGASDNHEGGDADGDAENDESRETDGPDGDSAGATQHTEHDVDTDADADADTAASDARKISTREAQSYAENEGLLFFEASAKSGKNVTEVFTAIANAIPETNLKTSRTGGAGVGGNGIGGGNLGARAGQSRVDLRERGAETKSDCAC
ncbi:hypothetical protein KEM56_002808 [Ascosphaera pollenicola]|nr:hypothetical protein KEM56_002808 [Ascosphaera pollenicola]